MFAKKRSNSVLAILMAVSFYLQILLSMLIFGFLGFGGGYWPATAHPIIRLPVFFMGVCAGELCIRIQQGDIDACQSMYHHCTFNNTKDNFKQLLYPRK